MRLPSLTPLVVLVLVSWALPLSVLPSIVVRARERGRTVENYRGRRVASGLGLVWLVWALAIGLPAAAVRIAPGVGRWVGYSAPALVIAVLVGGTAVLGWLDDTFGDSSSRGFKGHLLALIDGRPTTGLLKVGGVGMLALWSTLPHAAGRPFPLVAWLASAAIVALAANAVNLLDVRPGRALKGFAVLLGLAVLMALSLLAGPLASVRPYAAPSAVTALWLAVAGIGPALLAWPYDLGERAMMGDAGANAMGALAGYVLAMATSALLGQTGLLAIAAALLALNLASERVSFSSVIERTPWLAAIDRFGRSPDAGQASAAVSPAALPENRPRSRRKRPRGRERI